MKLTLPKVDNPDRPPKNILLGHSPYTGQEIKDFVWYHAMNRTKFSLIAVSMRNCFNLFDDQLYRVTQHKSPRSCPNVVVESYT